LGFSLGIELAKVVASSSVDSLVTFCLERKWLYRLACSLTLHNSSDPRPLLNDEYNIHGVGNS
jgi:hypothetical protein